ncbi:MAG: cobalt ECF transporter T component CbiQ [Micromonosporaceae bacterium]|nr:cobalt ECF transporter T component CbiQ [Micromonosporaceae bacterium]
MTGVGYADRLYLPADTAMHRLPGHVKLVAALGFVLAVGCTPREQFWAFGGHAGLLAIAVARARIPITVLLRRLTVELPFLAFAILMPFLASGRRVEVLGVGLSVTGLLDAWNILAKATLGVSTSIVLAATTNLRDLLLGLERLRLPSLLIQIMSFMIRYGDLILAETHRMRIARESRGFVARDVRQVPVLARSVGALFIRVYERGERVHLAMLSRGYTGGMPGLLQTAAVPAQWAGALALPLAAATVAAAAWTRS